MIAPLDEGEAFPVFDEPRDPGPRLRDRRVSLDVRDVTVRELVKVLAAQGIVAYASEEAWSSRGTFSVVARNEPLGRVLGNLRWRAPIRGWIDEDLLDGGSGEVVMLSGAPASTTEALSRSLPDVRAKLTGTIASMRRELLEKVEDRRRRRDEASVDPVVLGEAERETSRMARELLDEIASLERLAATPLALRTAREELAREHAALASERDAVVAGALGSGSPG